MILSTFLNFMQWISEDDNGFSQSARIYRACGRNCTYDRLLHTENLTASWAKLIVDYNLPHVALPHLNSVTYSDDLDATLTPQIISIINRVDERMFTDFGYSMRTP